MNRLRATWILHAATCRALGKYRRTVQRLCVLVICASGLVNLARGGEATWQAGVARRVITPEKGVWLAGYGSKRPPDGKLHDLWMKALALEDTEGRRAVLVT